MATIERIRKRSGLLIIVVFVALMSFVLGDLFRSGGSKLFGDPNVIGSINDRDITRQELMAEMDELKMGNPQYEQMSSIQLANLVWDQLKVQTVLGEELAAAGFGYSKEELFLDICNNPNIQQAFVNQQGVFDQNLVRNYIAQLRDARTNSPEAEEMWLQWLAFENAVNEQGMSFKYNTALEKGIHMPAGLVAIDKARELVQVPAQYVYVPYIDINEDEISVDEADAKRYYQNHKDDFKQGNARNLEFINFQLLPSIEDREAVRAELALLALQWIDEENDSVFTNVNSDTRFNPAYVTIDELIGTGFDTIVDGQDVGFIKGPFEDIDNFTIIKITGKKQLADSVEARHILIPFAGASRVDPSVTRTPQEAQALADSLFAVLEETPSKFEELSTAYSSDVVAKGKGGNLGYFTRGAMTPQFENFCFYRKTGAMDVIFTEFGFHIVEITDQKGSNDAYQIAQITRQILPSEKTIQDTYAKASKYAQDAQTAEDYRALAAEQNLFIRPARNVKQFDEVIPGLGLSRRVVRWAWEDDRQEGNIGLLENDGKGYVVAILTDILEEGTAPFEKVLDECMEGAKREAKKDVLEARAAEAVKGASTIQEVADALGVSSRSLNFNVKRVNIPGIGNEAKVIGEICGMPVGEMSAPLLGENGVFVVMAQAPQDAGVPSEDYTNESKSVQRSLRNLVGTQAIKALQSKATITDNRFMMF